MTACYKIPGRRTAAYAGMTPSSRHRSPARAKWLAVALALQWLIVSAVFGDEVIQTSFDYDTALTESQAAIGKQLGNHRFTTTDGRTIGLDELRGKPLLVSMIYTSCHQICPMTTQHLASVVAKARKTLGYDSFNVALIGFDSAADTPEAMRFFGARQGVIGHGWYLLSTDAATIDALSRDLGFRFTQASHGFDHLIQASVIDADGRVYRQVYGQVFETPLLIDPLIELVLGRPAPEQSLLGGIIARVKLFCTTYDPVRDGYYYDYSLFLGILIGAVIILATASFIVRELRRH